MGTSRVFVDVGTGVVRKSDGVTGTITDRRRASGAPQDVTVDVTFLTVTLVNGERWSGTLTEFAGLFRAGEGMRLTLNNPLDAINPPTLVKSWKIEKSARGVELTLNGQRFELGPSAAALAFDLAHAMAGPIPCTNESIL